MRFILFALFFIPLILNAQFPDNTIVPDSLVTIWRQAGIDSALIPPETIYSVHDYVEFDTSNGLFQVSSDSFMVALNQLPWNGERVLFFPSGTYEFTVTASDVMIRLPSNLILRGEGAANTIFKLVAETDSSIGFFYIDSVNTGIEFLKIDASEMFSSSFSQDQAAVELLTANRNIFFFSSASNCWLYGVETFMSLGTSVIVSRSDHIWVHGCYFHDAWLHGNHLDYGTQGYGISFSGDSMNRSTYCLVENNIFEKFRHAINLQYYAKHNVISYNYTKSSRAYNFLGGISFNSPTADFVLHGQGASENLIEGNVFAGGGIANGLNIDKVKVIPNGPRNVVYRNFSFRGLVVQKNACNYNREQLLIANQSANFLIEGEAHFIHCNIDTFGALAQSVGVDCSTNLDNENQCNASLIGVSCYLAQKPCWMNTMNLPSVGIQGSSSYTNAAVVRYGLGDKALFSRECPVRTSMVNWEVHDFVLTPNPIEDYVQLSFSEEIQGFVAIFDMLGKEIYKTSIKQTTWAVSSNEWPDGVYFVVLYDMNHAPITHKKLVKN